MENCNWKFLTLKTNRGVWDLQDVCCARLNAGDLCQTLGCCVQPWGVVLDPGELSPTLGGCIGPWTTHVQLWAAVSDLCDPGQLCWTNSHSSVGRAPLFSSLTLLGILTGMKFMCLFVEKATQHKGNTFSLLCCTRPAL